jgi:hypothetical protein
MAATAGPLSCAAPACTDGGGRVTAFSGPADRARLPAMRLHGFKVQTEALQHLADGGAQVGFLVNARMHPRPGLRADNFAVTIDLFPQPLGAKVIV